jgi:tetratricopeptide (TPR) repeat protein
MQRNQVDQGLDSRSSASGRGRRGCARIPGLLVLLILSSGSGSGAAEAQAPADTAGATAQSGVPRTTEAKEKQLVELEALKRKNTKSTDPKEAEIDRLLAEVAKDPQSFDLQYQLANAYHEAGHAHSALAAYNEAVKIDDRQSRAWVNRGVVLKDLGRAEDAEESFRKALAANPDDALARINLGDELLTQKKYQEAVDAYRHAIRIDPGLPNSYYSLAIAFAESGLYRDAAQSWRKCAELARAKGTPGDLENADRALENAKLMDEIITDAEKALKDREEKQRQLEGAQKRAAEAAAPGAAGTPAGSPAPETTVKHSTH